MLRAYGRLFVIYRDYRRHLVICQALLLVSGAASIGMATLTQHIINKGLVAGDTTVIVAPTNAGKTSAMATIAIANVQNRLAQVIETGTLYTVSAGSRDASSSTTLTDVPVGDGEGGESS